MPASCKSHGSGHSAGTATISSSASRYSRPCRPSSSAPSSATNSATCHASRPAFAIGSTAHGSHGAASRTNSSGRGAASECCCWRPSCAGIALTSALTRLFWRANEYDADKASAEVAGRDNTAGALTTIAAKGRYLGHKFWSDLNKRAAVDPQPPAHPFENYLGLTRALPASEVEAGLAHALAATTSHSDTHPCLTDRLKALDMPPQPLAPLAVTAGEALLGDLRPKLIGDTDALWSAKLASSWKGAHEHALARQVQIAELAAGAAAGRLDAEGLLRYASLLEEAEGPAQAMPWLDAALQQRREHASALFMRGRLKLCNGDEEGVREIEAAMQLDSDALEPGSPTSTSAAISPAASRSSTISSVSQSNAGWRR